MKRYPERCSATPFGWLFASRLDVLSGKYGHSQPRRCRLRLRPIPSCMIGTCGTCDNAETRRILRCQCTYIFRHVVDLFVAPDQSAFGHHPPRTSSGKDTGLRHQTASQLPWKELAWLLCLTQLNHIASLSRTFLPTAMFSMLEDLLNPPSSLQQHMTRLGFS